MNDLLLFAAGLAGLLLGAELLVRGASRLALSIGISPLVVGLTVVAFGTSAPEMAVSVGAVLQGQRDLALGNAVGSNVFNVLFILGLAAVIAPLAVHRQVIRQEAPIMIGSAILLLVLTLDGELRLFDGVLLFVLMLAYTVFLVRQSRAQEARASSGEPPPAPARGRAWQLLLVAAGLALLVLGARALVAAAVGFARDLGLSETVIGLTIVAAGTSLPEVAASVVAAFKGERDIAVGNVVGSCVFNVLGVLGLGSLAAAFDGSALAVPASVRDYDLWVMLAAFIACVPVFRSGREIARWEGALFLAYYVGYVAYLVLAAQRHEGVEAFSDVMLGVVLPLTVVTLGVLMLRR